MNYIPFLKYDGHFYDHINIDWTTLASKGCFDKVYTFNGGSLIKASAFNFANDDKGNELLLLSITFTVSDFLYFRLNDDVYYQPFEVFMKYIEYDNINISDLPFAKRTILKNQYYDGIKSLLDEDDLSDVSFVISIDNQLHPIAGYKGNFTCVSTTNNKQGQPILDKPLRRGEFDTASQILPFKVINNSYENIIKQKILNGQSAFYIDFDNELAYLYDKEGTTSHGSITPYMSYHVNIDKLFELERF